VSRITSGDEWKYRNGEADFRGRGMGISYRSRHTNTTRSNPSDNAPKPTRRPASSPSGTITLTPPAWRRSCRTDGASA